VVSARTQLLLAAGGFALAAALGWLLAPRLRHSPELRFFALGSALALLPLTTTFPSDRLLYFVVIGAMPLVATVICGWLDRSQELRTGAARRRALALLGPALVVVHAVVAPARLPFRTLRMADYHAELVRASDSAYGVVRSPDEILVAVNAPDFYFCKMLREVRWTRIDPGAVSIQCLAGTLAPTRVMRLDPNAIEVTPAFGFLERPFNRTYRSPRHPMKPGDSVFVGSAQIVVTAVDARGAPTSATFRFVYPLESEKLRFVAWRDGVYVPFVPPAIGQSVVLDPLAGR
jgi:hypothetical protein